jgi:hypothetical protein
MAAKGQQYALEPQRRDGPIAPKAAGRAVDGRTAAALTVLLTR